MAHVQTGTASFQSDIDVMRSFTLTGGADAASVRLREGGASGTVRYVVKAAAATTVPLKHYFPVEDPIGHWYVELVSGTTPQMTIVGDRHRGFVPADIDGLVVWYDANTLKLGLTDGDPVATWTDLSGRANHLTQSTPASRPTLQLNERAGKPVVRFDGTDDWVEKTSGIDLGGLETGADKPFSVFVTALTNAGGTATDYFVLAGAGSIPRYYLPNHPTSGNINFHKRDDAFNTASTSSFSDSAGTLVAISATSPGTTLSAWKNAAQVVNAEAFDVGVTTITTINIGWWQNAHNMDMAEVALFNVELSTPNRQAMENYMMTKWGLA